MKVFIITSRYGEERMDPLGESGREFLSVLAVACDICTGDTKTSTLNRI